MLKQILHIILFTTLAFLLLSNIAKSQDYRNMSEQTDLDSGNVPEEVIEYVYKYDMPVEENTSETGFDELPSDVKAGFLNSKFSNWDLLKVFKLEQDGSEKYMLVVEKRGYIETLYFNRMGKIITDY